MKLKYMSNLDLLKPGSKDQIGLCFSRSTCRIAYKIKKRKTMTLWKIGSQDDEDYVITTNCK